LGVRRCADFQEEDNSEATGIFVCPILNTYVRPISLVRENGPPFSKKGIKSDSQAPNHYRELGPYNLFKRELYRYICIIFM